MSIILNGKDASLKYKEDLKNTISTFTSAPTLAIIHFNEPASISYLKGRHNIANEIGAKVVEYPLDTSISEDKIISLIESLNIDTSIDAIMIDRPLPKNLDESKILNTITPIKDVDGYTNINLGNLISNKECYHPCTPEAALRLLDFYNIDVSGKDCLVIGRSINVGKPLALLLLNRNATVQVTHSKTKDLFAKTKNADIVFLAIGRRDFLHLKDVKESSIVVDIGINYDENGKICGDASKDIYDQIYAYSPVPRGVGVLTNVCLMENVCKAYRRNHGK